MLSLHRLRRALLAGVALLVTLTLVSLAAPASADTAVYDDVDTQQPDARMQVLPSRCLASPGDSMPSRARKCQVAKYGKKRPTIVVWGDSHSWQQTPAITAYATATRKNLVTFQMGTCPPMDLRGTSHRSACAKVGMKAMNYITKLSRKPKRKAGPVTVVVGGFWHLYHDLGAKLRRGWTPETGHEAWLAGQARLFAQGGERAFRKLDRLRVRTIGIGQMPWVPESAPVCEAGMDPYACDLPRAEALADEAVIGNWLATRVDAVADATPYVCDAGTCTAAVGGRTTFIDDLHLNPAIAPAFRPVYAKAYRAAR